MDEKELQRLKALFHSRALGAAFELGADVYAQGSTQKENSLFLEAQYWFACTCRTIGQYQDSQNHLEKGIMLLHQLLDSKDLKEDNFLRFQSLLELSKSYYSSEDKETATAYRIQALQWAAKYNSEEAIILTKIEACKAAIDTNAFDAAHDIAVECLHHLKSKELSKPTSLEASILNLMGRTQIKKQDILETLKISQEALRKSRAAQDVENELIALNNLAIVHGIKSEYKEAMEFLMEALDISQKIQFQAQTARLQINMGSIYAHLFNHTEALRLYKSTLEDFDRHLESGTRVVLHNNIGNIYYNLEDADQAAIYFQQAYQLAKNSHYKEMEALSLAQLARVYRVQSKMDLAMESSLAAKKILDQLGIVNGAQIVLINLGKIYYAQKKYDQAIKSLSQGVVLAKTLKDDLSEIRGYDMLSKAYFEQGHLEQAYDFLQVYTAYRESYSKVQRNRQLLDLEIQYGIQEKQKEIEQLQIENEYQALLLEQKDKIEVQNEQLLEANKDLKQFASIVSHDLKEPLRMIRSFGQILQKKYEGKTDSTTKECLGFITEGATRMDKLLSGLMHYATIGKEYEETQIVDLQEIIEICCLHLRLPIQEAQAKIEVDTLPSIPSKHSLLIHLFQNLIGNAIKFRKPEQVPHIHIHAHENENTWRITVTDNGIGIPKKNLKQIFEIFQRLHRDDAYEGTGVGLAVCQKIVKRLGGQLRVESEVGEGTNFFVDLPKTQK